MKIRKIETVLVLEWAEIDKHIGMRANFVYLSILLSILCSCNNNDFKSGESSIKQTLVYEVLFAEVPFAEDTSFTCNQIIDRLQHDTINTFILNEVKNKIHFLLPNIKAKVFSASILPDLANGQLLLTNIENLTPQYSTAKIDAVDFFNNPENYPLQSLKSDAIKTRAKITLLNITGVTAITRGVCNAIEKIGIDSLICNIKPYFEKADFVHISNEVSISPNCECKSKTLVFCSKKEHFEILKKLNFNIVELTGNHNRDYGDKAFIETLKWYKENNIKAFGGGLNPGDANTPLILRCKDGTSIGFIGFNELCPLKECADKPEECGANRYENEKARLVLKKMRTELKCDYIIASVQFGESDSYYPTSSQKKISSFLINNGADLVYGSQAHQVQQIEFVQDKPVFFGLGNFIFDQLQKKGLRQGYFLQLYFYNKNLIQIRPVYTWMNSNLQLEVLTGEKAKEIQEIILPEKINK